MCALWTGLSLRLLCLLLIAIHKTCTPVNYLGVPHQMQWHWGFWGPKRENIFISWAAGRSRSCKLGLVLLAEPGAVMPPKSDQLHQNRPWISGRVRARWKTPAQQDRDGDRDGDGDKALPHTSASISLCSARALSALPRYRLSSLSSEHQITSLWGQESLQQSASRSYWSRGRK